ncbi:MAG: hypothetical protein J1E16_05995 [Muribaculaceae bacterium]|nr:hypothetical protein [Muribaculaceae bacterium]
MNKLINYILIILFLFLPIIVKAQPPGEGWIRLGEFIDGKYEINNFDIQYAKIGLKSYDATQDIYISKIAYKPINKNSDPNAILYLLPIKIENGEIKSTNDVISISNDFVISENKEKIKTKNLPKEDGWLIYNISNPAFLYMIDGLNSEDVNRRYINLSRNPIFNNFYVFLDPDKDPAKVAKETNTKKRQEFDKTVFTTPQEKGWTPIRTDNLEDGTIVEHYDEGIRLYKKPNGDFMSFIQPEDTRDPKTLDVIKGMDQDFFTSPNKRTPVGAYQLTLPNGIIIAGNGVTGEIRFSNGSKVISDNDGSIFIPIKLRNELIAFPAVFPISYDTFLEYETYKNHDIRFMHLPPINKPDNLEMLVETKYSDRFNPDLISYAFKKKPLKFIYIKEGESDRYFYFQDFDSRLLFYLSSDSELSQVYYPEKEALKPFAIEGLIIPWEIETIYTEEDNNTIKFTNKDYIKWSRWGIYSPDEVHLTLSDGTIIEKFPDFKSYKITLPNGDKFVGEIELDDFLSAFEFGDYNFKNGQLSTHDGKNYEYQNFINKTKRDAEVAKLAAAVQKALYSKYGKSDIDEALAGHIKTGMKLQMLKDLNIPLTLDDESSSSAWYKMATEITYNGDVKYRWIRVNKSTGKIDYIGSQRTGGFMSY